MKRTINDMPDMDYLKELDKSKMTPFERQLDSLDLTYAQEELIKQAVENHIIGKDIETDELMNERLGTATIMNLYKKLQRGLLRGER